MTTTPAPTCSRSTSGICARSSTRLTARCRSRPCAPPGTGSSPPVRSRRLFGSMRVQLAAAIALVTLGALTGSFFALHQRAGSDLQGRIDSNLREQVAEFQQNSVGSVERPAQLARAARSFISSQRYHPESRIFLIQVNGGRNITNEQNVIDEEAGRRT